MSSTVKRFRAPIPSPQPWKLEVPRPLDLAEEMEVHDDPTVEFLITEPDDYMDGLSFDDEITQVFER